LRGATMKTTVVCVLLLCLAGPGLLPARAQVQELKEDMGAAGAHRALLRLRSTATVLFTQAHPDDEDAALVTWVARRAGVRTGILSINRGEGGANLIGPEQYDALGVLRTEEFLAACRHYGVQDLMFTRMADFGFSKRLDETLEHWGKENVLGDMVRVVRAYRPDVIISRFHGQPRDGHGNHQAAGLLTREAFKLAADPQAFPEQIKEGLQPWQAKKLYLGTRASEPSTLKIDVGEYAPLLGRSYREVGMEGYGLHRSQSVGLARPAPGSFYSSLRLVESAVPKVENEQSIFDGLDTSIVGLAKLTEGKLDLTKELAEISNNVEAAIRKFDAREPWAVAGELAVGKRAVRAAIDKVGGAKLEAAQKDRLLFLLGNKAQELNDAMNHALGLKMEALVDPEKKAEGPMAMFQPRETFAAAIPGQQFSVTMRVVNRSKVKLEIPATPLTLDLSKSAGILGPREKLKVQNPGIVASTDIIAEVQPGKLEAKSLEPGAGLTRQFTLKVSDRAAFTRPYWSRDSELRDHQYKFSNPHALGWPFEFPGVLGLLVYKVDDASFTLTQPVQTSFVAAPRGEQRRLLAIAPAMSVAMTPRVGVVPLGSSSTTTNVTVSVSSSAQGRAEGKVKLRAPAGWRVEPSEQPFGFEHEGEQRSFTFKVTIPAVKPDADYKLQAVAEYAGREYTEGYQVIAHRDLEPRHLYRDAVMTIRGMDVKVAPNLSVGYVMGVGDRVPEALEQIGVKVTLLGANELASGNLDQFDAIIVGIRASAVREDLKAHNKRLLEYVERGGNLIWQYQTPEFDQVAYGPYPYKMGRNPEEVSEEEAKVTILEPANPVFNWPNKITEADFNGWVEERGSKWLGEWDARYTPLLEAHDRGQAPQRGGMLQAQYGRGTFTYAAYAFYRQLPAGVEGAYRLFANLVSLKRRGE
jgi:LmbE family N-acetylglucosaminyl deacetylase